MKTNAKDELLQGETYIQNIRDMDDLCEKYGIDAYTVLDCLNNAVQSYAKNTIIVLDVKEGEINLSIFKRNLERISGLGKDTAHKILKLFRYYLNLAKFKSNYSNFIHLKDGLILYGNLQSKIKDDWSVNLDYQGLPADTECYYPLVFQPISERKNYAGGEYLAFVLKDIVRREGGNMRFILSRTSPKMPSLIISEELKIYFGIETKKRIPGVISVIKSNINIPQKTIDYAKELLKGERIYVFKAKK